MTDPDRTLAYHIPQIVSHLAAAHGMQKVSSEAVMGELRIIPDRERGQGEGEGRPRRCAAGNYDGAHAMKPGPTLTPLGRLVLGGLLAVALIAALWAVTRAPETERLTLNGWEQ